MGAAMEWTRRQPEQEHAWLWQLLLPSLLLHVPAPPRDGRHTPTPLTRAARAAALLSGEFAAALADRNAGMWRPPPDGDRPGGGGSRSWAGGARRGGRVPPTAALPPTAAERRVLRLVRAGRLSAAARALLAEPAAPCNPAVLAKAGALFPPATPALAAVASVEAAQARPPTSR